MAFKAKSGNLCPKSRNLCPWAKVSQNLCPWAKVFMSAGPVSLGPSPGPVGPGPGPVGPGPVGPWALGPRALGPKKVQINAEVGKKTQKDIKINQEVIILKKNISRTACTRKNTKSSKTDQKFYQIKK